MKPRKSRWLIGGMMFGVLVSTLALLSGYFVDLEVSSGRFTAKDNAAWTAIFAISTVAWGVIGVGTSSLLKLLQHKSG